MEGEMLKGHLDMIVLAALSAGPAHGYAVIEEIRRKSGQAFDLSEGTIYPALHRLDQAGLEVRGQPISAPSAWRHHALRVTTSIAPTAVGRRSTSWQDPLPACSPGRPCRAPYRVRQARTTTSRCSARALARAETAPPLRRVGRPASARLRVTAAQGNTSRAAPCRAARPAAQPPARTARSPQRCRPDAARRGLR